MQQVDNIAFVQVLRLKDTDLWQTKDGNLIHKSKGNLQALYSKEMGIYVLKLNEFKWHLAKSLQIVTSFDGNDGFFYYNIPTFDGFYTLKVHEAEAGPAITNFETFLTNTCHLIRKDNIHQNMKPVEGKLKETLHKTLDSITHVFQHHERETEANHRIVRSFQDMLTVEGHEVHVVDIPSFEILNLLQEAGEVIRHHQETEAWIALRGEIQPTLVEAGDKLFVEKPEIGGIERWGSNVTNVSTSTQHSAISTENLSLGSDRGLSGGSLEGGRIGQPNLNQNSTLSSNVLNSDNFRNNTTNTLNQPFDKSNIIKTDLA